MVVYPDFLCGPPPKTLTKCDSYDNILREEMRNDRTFLKSEQSDFFLFGDEECSSEEVIFNG